MDLLEAEKSNIKDAFIKRDLILVFPKNLVLPVLVLDISKKSKHGG